jgi:hypothetical protein
MGRRGGRPRHPHTKKNTSVSSLADDLKARAGVDVCTKHGVRSSPAMQKLYDEFTILVKLGRQQRKLLHGTASFSFLRATCNHQPSYPAATTNAAEQRARKKIEGAPER